MKLKTGLTYWSKINGPALSYPELTDEVSCDVAVIGGGISGALVAHQLIRAGFNVVLVDKRPVGTGSTSASTALLLYETDTSLAELTRKHGKRSAVQVYRLGNQAVRQLGQLSRSLKIDCGFRWRKSLYLASDSTGYAKLKEEYELRRAAGFPCSLLNDRQLKKRFGLHYPGAIYSRGSAQVDAMGLTRSLLAHHTRGRRLRIFQNTEIVALESSSREIRLISENDAVIAAKKVIVATGYEAAPFLKAGLVRLHSSYVIGSQRLPASSLWHDECLIWETARPYFYLRTTQDRRILMGGEDEPFADPRRRDARLPGKSRKLLQRFHRLFPGIPFQLKFNWTGTFGETKDGLPYIGAKPRAPRILYALGYGGNGITFSQIAATILAQICQGRAAPDAKLFRFER